MTDKTRRKTRYDFYRDRALHRLLNIGCRFGVTSDAHLQAVGPDGAVLYDETLSLSVLSEVLREFKTAGDKQQ